MLKIDFEKLELAQKEIKNITKISERAERKLNMILSKINKIEQEMKEEDLK